MIYSGMSYLLFVVLVSAILPVWRYGRQLWRSVVLTATVTAISTICLAEITGPWSTGWPTGIWLILVPILTTLLLGLMAALWTMSRGSVLMITGARLVAFGVAISTWYAFPLMEKPPEGPIVLTTLMQILFPSLLSGIIGVALWLTGRRMPFDPSRVRSWSLEKRRMMTWPFSYDQFRQALIQPIIHQVHRSGPIPVLLLIMTWQVWPLILDTSRDYLVLAVAFTALIVSFLLQRRPIAWLLVQSCMHGVTMWLLGLSGYTLMATVAVIVIVLCAFVRFPALGHGWSFPAVTLVVALIWPHMTQEALLSQQQISLVVVAGLLTLVCNVLVTGHARLLMLTACLMVGQYLLWVWVPIHDRFALVQVSYWDPRIELPTIGFRLLVMITLLSALWQCVWS